HIDARRCVPEEELHAGAFRGVEQQAIESGTRDGVDHLALVLAVGYERESSLDVVEHAARHRNQLLAHALHDAGELERADAARCECEIDRTSALDRLAAQVRETFVDLHPMTALREERREQSAREAGARDRDRRGLHRRTSSSSSVTNSYTSVNVL